MMHQLASRKQRPAGLIRQRGWAFVVFGGGARSGLRRTTGARRGYSM
ncbi:MAG TPA: hypothetical protein VFA21_01930 [Pyrinomonadaceae bacterium]|nr:hypothetical protein [Pyrinomonadaceae bacterium]